MCISTRNRSWLQPLLLVLTFSLAALVSATAHCSILTLELDIEFSGATAPEGSTPWITAVFEDIAAKTVRLTMSAVNLVDAESIKDWYFNIDPTLDLSLLSLTDIDISDSSPNAVNLQHDAYKADGDGFYDLHFDFPPPPGNNASRFTSGESLIYEFVYSGSEDFDALSFDFFDVGGAKGDYRSAAHIQRIGSSDSDSGWIGDNGDGISNPPPFVPEPTSVAVWSLIVGLGAVLTSRSKR
jgi:hypothetical protein